ncbi:2-oxoglutarate-dependent dioxygenase htyE [Amphibalanus amphitrite]|uniref:2-oxoglutarate-dependent dioxygenase htyE n=1 Tax=Amphibalanus amphitrite TaxID=1232801 RepID=A0A6A4VQB5_AMPAM|nr:2-oxoglutarate-dependent dioxygenase ecdK-like [Amphibalanus amphitrite]XP_043202142.1 2-oxoglutarate-dependent dioxygenase ecdK-like [Amphibalanus amphitrite]XP_043202143.1 2-oxoglutarate-dependent dioxygenase ecdK-like [Amphibalanus amphitrite]XP_043202144.1 2-oxoglutarate-dependent dioxygenase ecdK-like [Amphibalanus amphitrite]XP_043202145.1 2-oxoglutarate-dependent dioxygenase ecdK-like [Amphibalanus amphitrite]XP_043202146.1 2-oxoglutarate-dependent dioxygenase ecdK-like [Amphibalanus
MTSAVMCDFPIIDISDIAESREAPSAEVLLAVGQRVVDAFQRSGFVYLRGHGIDANLQRETFAASRDFFALDEASKRRFARFEKTGFNGYTAVGGENTGRLTEADLLDLKECYDFQIIGQDYPDSVLPGFCQQLEQLARACCLLSGRLLAAVQEVLLDQQPAADSQQQTADPQHQQQMNGNQETDHSKIPSDLSDQPSQLDSNKLPTDLHPVPDAPLTTSEPSLTSRGPLTSAHRRMLEPGGCSALRVLNYPPVPEGAAEAGAVRCAAHTDYGSLTLLFQDQLGGLEVESADGGWRPAPPLEDAILVNVGDLMEVWSSGRLRATKHRVVVPQQELLRRRARQSIAMFVDPDDDVLVRPLDDDKRFAPVNCGKSLREKFAKTYPAFAEWQRSRCEENEKARAE